MDEYQKTICNIINQLHTIQNKSKASNLKRNFERLQNSFKALDLTIHNPIHERYNDTRMDCEATISGIKTENLRIVVVIKPIIYSTKNGVNEIIQRAIVIVEGV